MARRARGIWSILRPSVPEEVREELEFHLEMRVRELMAQGMAEAEARREAGRRFGDLEGIRDECLRLGTERERKRQRLELLRDVGQDVRFAGRLLWGSRGFAAVAVLTIALGIGATTSMFSVIDAVLLRPLPFPGADRLVVPQSVKRETGDTWNVTYADYEDWRAARVFSHVALFQTPEVNLASEDGSEKVRAARVTEDFFATLGLAPTLGRTFRPDEHVPGSPRVAVISEGVWKRLGGGRDVVGRTIRVAGAPVEVIGVMPAALRVPEGAEIWFPLQVRPEDRADYERRDNFIFGAVARLAPGKTLESTRAQLASMAKRVEEASAPVRQGVSVTATPLTAYIVGDRLARGLWLLLGAVGLVLLIGCVNVANLLLGRAAARQRELAIRTALGAGRLRLVRQLLTESLVLALVGGALGVLLAFGGVRLLVASAPPGLPRVEEVGVDATALLFALAAAVCSALAFGLLPAFRISGVKPATVVAESSTRATAGPGGRRGRNALVMLELALSLILLVGAGLMLRSFAGLKRTDPGFRTERTLTFTLALQGERYAGEGRVIATYRELLQRLRSVPGVKGAAVVSALPLGGGGFYLGRSFLAEGRPEPPAGTEVSGMWSVASPGYFATLEIPLREGRDFTERDGANATPVMVVNREFARQMFPGESAIGKRVRSWRDENVYREVVGVVDDVRFFGAGDEIRPLVYVPHAQNDWGGMVVVLHTAAAPRSVVGAVREVVRQMDPSLALGDVQSMDEVLATSVAPWRFGMMVLAVFAALALLLACIGLYGVLSYAIARRTREIGIRMAMGARPGDIRRLVMSDAGVVIGVGLLAGGMASLLAARAMSTLLYGVSPADPLTFAAVAALLALVALLASWVPARRAARVDPLVAIRAE